MIYYISPHFFKYIIYRSICLINLQMLYHDELHLEIMAKEVDFTVLMKCLPQIIPQILKMWDLVVGHLIFLYAIAYINNKSL